MKNLFLLVIFTSAISCRDNHEFAIHVENQPRLREDSVTSGMCKSLVAARLGTPSKRFIDAGGMEIWEYYESPENLKEGGQIGGLTIAFKDEIVRGVIPIRVSQSTYK
jgi:hypothetical protein